LVDQRGDSLALLLTEVGNPPCVVILNLLTLLGGVAELFLKA
jgi:hypothetical protein